MATRKKDGPVACPTVAERKSELLAAALGVGYSVEVLDDETVRIVSHGRRICSISFDAEPPSCSRSLTTRT